MLTQLSEIVLDVRSTATLETGLSFVRNDRNAHQLRLRIDGVEDWSGVTAHIKFLRRDGQSVVDWLTMTGGVATCTVPAAALAVAGRAECEISLFAGGARRTTHRIAFLVRADIDTDGTAAADPKLPVLEGLLEEVAALKSAAELAQAAQVAEAERLLSESSRIEAEALRRAQESARIEAEAARGAAESVRVTAETMRAENEAERVRAEGARLSAEDERISAEAARAEQDAARGVWEDYAPVRDYAPGNKVSHAGSSYLCLMACQGIPPENTLYWRLIAAKGETGQRGEKGDTGAAAVVTALGTGLFSMQVDAAGHLLLTFREQETPPPISVENGHLVYTIG